MLAHLCDVTRENTVHVGETRFFRHQDPHAFWPRGIRDSRQLWIQFVLNRVSVDRLLWREVVFQRRSFRERHPSFSGILFFCVDAHALLSSILQTLVRELFELKVRRYLSLLYKGLSATRRM